MPISSDTAAQIQRELGDQDANTLAPFLSGLWDNRNDKNLAGMPGLQYYYCKRDAVDILIGNVWNQVTTSTGDQKTALNEKTANLQAIRKNVQDEINKLERRSTANRAPAVGDITTTSPVTPTGPIYVPTTTPPDPNDPAYGGDPQRIVIEPTYF